MFTCFISKPFPLEFLNCECYLEICYVPYLETCYLPYLETCCTLNGTMLCALYGNMSRGKRDFLGPPIQIEINFFVHIPLI